MTSSTAGVLSISATGVTAVENGVTTVTVHGSSFPLVVRNIAPTIAQTPNLNLANSGGGVREGQSITITPNATPGRFDVKVNGTTVDQLIVTDPGTQDLATLDVRASIENPDGTSSDLSQRALTFGTSTATFLPNVALRRETFNGLTSFTTAFWMKTTNTGRQTLVSAANSTFTEEFSIYLLNNTTVRVVLHNQEFSWTVPSLSDNVFHHVAVVVDL